MEAILDSLERILRERLDYAQGFSDLQIEEIIDEILIEQGKNRGWSVRQRNTYKKELFYSVRKLDVLQELLEDDQVTEIMVNGYQSIFVERGGKITRWDKQFSSSEKLEDVIQQIVGNCNRVVNERTPIVDARLQNGARVNVVIAPVALNGPILTIRRFPDKPVTMNQLIEWKSITVEAAHFLKKLVEAGYSIMIGGGTSSGKTTFLNALSNYIPKTERIITIEDNAELQIQGVDNLVRLEAKAANMEGTRPITIRDLIKSALRMRPNRIIIGEVRAEETLELLQILNTGHDGSLSTAHANSAKDMISRLETMVLMGVELPVDAIRRQIASGIDIMVHLGRLKDQSRRVLEIQEILGYQDGNVLLNKLFSYQEEKGLVKVSELTHREKLERAGICL